MHKCTTYGIACNMSVITVRVDAETRKAMRRHRDINWSEVIRQRIRETLVRRSRRNKLKAVLIAEELSRKPPEGYDSTKVIRYWREQLYGPRRGRR